MELTFPCKPPPPPPPPPPPNYNYTPTLQLQYNLVNSSAAPRRYIYFFCSTSMR
ncbi:hypothetical protein FOCG_12522 [Fusarium oxysporum f. sp. radicis-lycopersici 26381]|nr:hypothetical protein FOCG_12522 [Fusarium oxysporum f. sp. radicis-lycopersici 26381]